MLQLDEENLDSQSDDISLSILEKRISISGYRCNYALGLIRNVSTSSSAEQITIRDIEPMLCEPARYLMLTNSLSSLRVSVRSEDMRENSVLADYEIKLWALRTILKFLSTPVAEDPLDRSEDDLATRLVIKSLIDPCPYSLTQRSINELALFKPLSNEVLDAYIHLLVTKRCHSDMLREDDKLFHFFDSLFYC